LDTYDILFFVALPPVSICIQIADNISECDVFVRLYF